MARIAALVVVLALAALPAAAPAAVGDAVQQQAPLVQDQPAQEVPQQAPVVTPEPDDGSVSRGDLLLIVVIVVVLIGAIWLVIARDARRATAGRTRSEPGALSTGSSATRAAHRTRKLSAAEKRRRKRGRAR